MRTDSIFCKGSTVEPSAITSTRRVVVFSQVVKFIAVVLLLLLVTVTLKG